MSSRRRVPRALAALAVGALAGLAAAQDAPPAPDTPPKDAPSAPSPPPPREPFRGSAEDLAAKFPQTVALGEIGRSRGGLPIRTLTVAPAAEVSWVALVLHGVSGGRPEDEAALVLDVAARLAEDPASISEGTAFRFVLRASPDAGPVRAGNAAPTDEDRDGATDEDPPDDLDGDGVVGWMRFPDPAGAFAAGDDAAALPKRADPAKGLAAAWTIVPEGRDDDGDGEWNEDGPGGVDVGRNFAVGFEEHVPAAGRWAASEPETRALMDHLLADERIALVYEIGGAETVAGNPDWGGAWAKLPDEDAKLLEGLRAAHGKGHETPLRKPRAPGAGSPGVTVWHQLGRIWMGRAPLGRVGPPWPAAGAEWPAHSAIPRWTPVEGPGVPPGAEVGLVAETDASKSAPRPEVFAETPSIADFLVLAAKERARVAFTKTETTGGSGVLRIETRLANAGRLPTHTQRGADVKGRRPLNVRVVLPDGATLLAGKPLVQIERLAGGAESEVLRWVVTGTPGAAVRVTCTGPDTGKVEMEARIP